MCKASIIVPAYNAEKYIESTINSILSQDFSDFEIIVVNDGSTDSTEEKVKAATLLDGRVKYIAQPNSGGPAKPRNVGISCAKGEFIFIFDADDLMLKGKLRHSIECLERFPDADLLFTNFSTIDALGHTLKESFLDEYDTLWNLTDGKSLDCCYLPAEKINPAVIKVNFIGTSGVVLRRSALDISDRFDETLKNSDDRLFWMLFSLRHNFVFLNRVLHQYRILPGSISNQGFIRRGPSKIRALKTVMDRVNNQALKNELALQISRDYATLAYGFQQKGDYRSQRKNALHSLKYKLNYKAIKLLMLSLMKGIKKNECDR